MARITVEDCLARVDNRFELVLIAARRARDLALGQATLLDVKGDKLTDKPTVIALRELADGKLDTLIKEKYGRFSAPATSPLVEPASASAAEPDEPAPESD